AEVRFRLCAAIQMTGSTSDVFCSCCDAAILPEFGQAPGIEIDRSQCSEFTRCSACVLSIM
ncbi:MAG: hypothetical protein WCF88_07955, partial [Candidatus Acidiferrales bacterium]